MTDKEIVQSLRCCADGECKDCTMHEDMFREFRSGLTPMNSLSISTMVLAARLTERLTQPMKRRRCNAA